jgi:TolB protein
MNVDGSSLRLILDDPIGPTSPSWSADGARIVFESGLGHERTGSGDRDIYEVEIVTREVTRLTTDPARDEYPAVSMDGSRIAFTRQSQGDGHTYLMNADGSGVTQPSSGEGIDLRPAWSPDGMSLVFERDGDIYLMDADGSHLTRLTEGPSEDGNPVWAPTAR